jgi:hypothetical protein
VSANGIATYNEKPLHAALKGYVAGDGGAFEVPVAGYVADCVHDGVLIEIQTGGFGKLRRKLRSLLEHHPVRLVHPIPVEKWIVRVDASGKRLGRRKSTKRGRWEDVFEELVAFPRLLLESHFTLTVVMVKVEEVRVVGGRRRRRGQDWRRHERRLLDVVGQRLFSTPEDLLREIPPDLPSPFTTADLARCLSMPRRLSQKMAYCLREMGAITPVGKARNEILYALYGNANTHSAPPAGTCVVVP